MATDARLEGLTLAVADITRSVEFYGEKLGFTVEVNGPRFAMIRVGGSTGGTIGLLSMETADAAGAKNWTAEQRAAIHVELSSDDIDALYEVLTERGVHFASPPHDEPWERSMHTYDPDGYTVEFAQGLRGHNTPS